MTHVSLIFRRLAIVCTLSVAFAAAATAQSDTGAFVVPLVVDEGFPMQVVLTQKLQFKEDEPVFAQLIEPVYAFDREVIPAGSKVIGRITRLQEVGKWKRATSMLGGDFTPQREPAIVFEAIELADGTRMNIDTVVTPDTDKTIRFNSSNKKRKGSENALLAKTKESQGDHVKSFLWSLSPYHPQSVSKGTRLRAILQSPLHFGTAIFREDTLADVGSEPAPGSVLAARLITALDSRTTKAGADVDAMLLRPVFSSDKRLLFPAGSMLHGEVKKARAARSFHRHGQLAFNFTSIEPPAGLTGIEVEQRRIKGRMVAVQVTRAMDDLRINEKGEPKISESKKRFVSPIYSAVKAGFAFGSEADPFDRALVGAYQSKVTRKITGKDTGLGIAGSVVGAMVPPVGIGLGIYGAARSIYKNFLGKGLDIRFPADTTVEVRLE